MVVLLYDRKLGIFTTTLNSRKVDIKNIKQKHMTNNQRWRKNQMVISERNCLLPCYRNANTIMPIESKRAASMTY